MYIILTKDGEKQGYIQNMMLFDETQDKVIGILIGDCFFGKQKQVIGKIFNSTAYLINGEIVGKIANDKDYKNKAPKREHMLAAWDILANIKEHTSTWITETNKWSTSSLYEHLS